jgi:hypothetical protein
MRGTRKGAYANEVAVGSIWLTKNMPRPERGLVVALNFDRGHSLGDLTCLAKPKHTLPAAEWDPVVGCLVGAQPWHDKI